MRAILEVGVIAAALAVGTAVTAGCGSSGNASPQPTSNAAGSTLVAGLPAQDVQTVHDDASSFTTALDEVSATCPVAKVTLETLSECKTSMQALIRVDNKIASDLGTLEAPAAVQPAIAALRTSLASLNAAQAAIIRTYIDEHDIRGAKRAGGLGSPIDNAINAAKAAFADLQLAASGG